MKSVCAKFAPDSLLLMVVFVLLLASAVPLNAQQKQNVEQRPPTFTTGAPDSSVRAPSVRERERIMREMEREANKPPTEEEIKLAFEQISEDYGRIQVVNNQLMAVAKVPGTPDYKLISDAAAEIQKRARRLKNNLQLPKPEDANAPYQSAEDVSQLKASFLFLDRKIQSFVRSSVFKNPDVVDAKAATKASRDLAAIIELSQAIAKDAERIGKSSPKP